MPPSAPISRIYRQGTSLYDAVTGQQLDNAATQNALKFANYDLGRIAAFDPRTDKSLVTAPPEAVTSSSGTLPIEEKKLVSDITNQSASTYSSPASSDYTKLLDDRIASLEQRRKEEEAAIQAQFDSLRQSTERQQASETGSTSAGLARAGGYLGVSGSGTGVLLNLAQTHRNEMSALESKRQAALAEARNAYSDKQFELARAKANEAKAIEKESYDRQQDYAKKIATATEALKKKNDEIRIFNAIKDGHTTAEDIYSNLGGDVSIDTVSNFLTKSTPKDAKGDFAYTNTQMATLLGSGLPLSEIKAKQEYINLHGYTDEFKKTLTPYQRVAYDRVYREKSTEDPVQHGTPIDIPTIEDFVKEYSLTDAGKKVKDQIQNSLQVSLTPEALYNEFKKNPDIQAIYDASVKAAQEHNRIANRTNVKFSPEEIRKLEYAGLTNAPREEQLKFLYQKKDDTNALIESLLK